MSILENNLAEHHLLKGEELIDNAAILELVEVEKNLWSIMIRDNGIIEVEIQNPNSKKQKSSCECEEYKSENSCAHIAAVLLYLRKIMDEKKVSAKNKEREKQKHTFNIKTILNEIDTEQLKNYVRSYAQKDRNFGILLKASFAKSIDLDDNLVKYQSILSSVIKPITTDKLKSTSADLRLALKVIDEFNSQLEDNMSISQFEDAFIILEATLPKLHYLYAKYAFRTDLTSKWIATFHNHLDLLYSEKLAPDFKERIDDFILNLSEKSYYNHLQNALSLFQIITKHKRSAAKSNLLSIYSNQHITTIEDSGKVVFGAILIINKMYDRLNINNDLKLESIKYLMQTDSVVQAIDYLEYFLKSEHRNRKMEIALIDAYQKQKMHKKFQELAIAIFVKHTDIRYYRILKDKIADSDWPKIKKKISKMISIHQPDSTFLGIYYFNEKMDDDLLNLLEQELDLRHIMKYDFYLYKDQFISLERIYHKALSSYLDSHAGSIAGNFMEEVFVHLSNIKAYKLETSVKKHISKHYPHRKNISKFSHLKQ